MKTVKKEIVNSFKVCPNCGYRNGFHLMFEKLGKTKKPRYKIKLICPNCSQVYDVGFKVEF
ncbi:MAG: hypothetical protein UT63_C0094G0003 [Candidatus Gottesmanbacteria bacterium GW2011_GWC2_39_8]|nr:MAG: hypothetical protein UT63_C0094G0003 [Candidatus Gottesmanbacteria bacterium GW2011_GWC2_39_8]